MKLSAALRFSRKLVLSSAAVGIVIVSQVANAKDPDFDESHGFLRVAINGKHYRLDSYSVKPADAKGPLPLALITNGTAGTTAEIRAENTAKGLTGDALELATGQDTLMKMLAFPAILIVLFTIFFFWPVLL